MRTIRNASLVTALKGKGRYQVVRLLLDYVSQKVTSPKPVYFANINKPTNTMALHLSGANIALNSQLQTAIFFTNFFPAQSYTCQQCVNVFCT
jgi:hypothetical protein